MGWQCLQHAPHGIHLGISGFRRSQPGTTFMPQLRIHPERQSLRPEKQTEEISRRSLHNRGQRTKQIRRKAVRRNMPVHQRRRTPQELFQTFRHDMPAHGNHQVRAQRLQVFLTTSAPTRPEPDGTWETLLSGRKTKSVPRRTYPAVPYAVRKAKLPP